LAQVCVSPTRFLKRYPPPAAPATQPECHTRRSGNLLLSPTPTHPPQTPPLSAKIFLRRLPTRLLSTPSTRKAKTFTTPAVARVCKKTPLRLATTGAARASNPTWPNTPWPPTQRPAATCDGPTAPKDRRRTREKSSNFALTLTALCHQLWRRTLFSGKTKHRRLRRGAHKFLQSLQAERVLRLFHQKEAPWPMRLLVTTLRAAV
jgi:hypothetical protein